VGLIKQTIVFVGYRLSAGTDLIVLDPEGHRQHGPVDQADHLQNGVQPPLLTNTPGGGGGQGKPPGTTQPSHHMMSVHRDTKLGVMVKPYTTLNNRIGIVNSYSYSQVRWCGGRGHGPSGC
jgi:hypothetical protein